MAAPACAPTLPSGQDVRFVVNTLAPYVLTRALLGAIGPSGRVLNISSAAQAPVNLDALAGRVKLPDGGAYAQSKLALIMWSNHMVRTSGDGSPTIISVNPGSMLGTKMVRDGFGVAGGDVGIGSRALAALSVEEGHESHSGDYFDNDARRYGRPHADALDAAKCARLVEAIDALVG